VRQTIILAHMSETDAEPQLLDVKGLNCPMPLLKAKKALNGMAPDALLKVLATDPGSVRDFEVFSQQSGHTLLEARQDGDTFVYVIRKKAG
jgi:tRNA 2-thiouridine synthesizing protein A